MFAVVHPMCQSSWNRSPYPKPKQSSRSPGLPVSPKSQPPSPRALPGRHRNGLHGYRAPPVASGATPPSLSPSRRIADLLGPHLEAEQRSGLKTAWYMWGSSTQKPKNVCRQHCVCIYIYVHYVYIYMGTINIHQPSPEKWTNMSHASCMLPKLMNFCLHFLAM